MTIEQAMTETATSRMQHCPKCNQTIDPLRSPAVSVINGKIVHFCSSVCRETYLRRVPELKNITTRDDTETPSAVHPETPQPKPKDVDVEDVRDQAPAFSQSELFRSKLIWPQLIQIAVLIVVLLLIVLLPPLLDGKLPMLIAALLIFGLTGWNVFRERRLGVGKILEAAAVHLPSLVLLLSGFFGLSPRQAAAFAAALPIVETAGRLLELAGRHRSGILGALDADDKSPIPTSWKDNSNLAAAVRNLSILSAWLRFPVAGLVALAVYNAEATNLSHALIAFATAFAALNPRTIRMATGDAHLRVALQAATRRVKVRDADAVQRAAQAKSVLFASRLTLFQPALVVLDWKTAENINPKSALDALLTLESRAEGRIARAVCAFATEGKARAASNADITFVEGDGLLGDTPWGSVLCGSRGLLLSKGISTGPLESQAAVIEDSGRRAVFLAMEDTVAAVFAIEEQFAAGAEESVRAVRRMGLETAMITTAEVAAAQGVADRLGIDTVYFKTPEEKLGEILRRISDSGSNAVLVGRGSAFEEHFRAADTAVSLGDEDTPTQAGFDAAGCGVDIVPFLIRLSRRAHKSAVRNLLLGVGTSLFGAGFAAAGTAPSMFLTVGSASFLAAALCTFNAPFPLLKRLFDFPSGLFRRVTKRLFSA